MAGSGLRVLAARSVTWLRAALGRWRISSTWSNLRNIDFSDRHVVNVHGRGLRERFPQSCAAPGFPRRAVNIASRVEFVVGGTFALVQEIWANAPVTFSMGERLPVLPIAGGYRQQRRLVAFGRDSIGTSAAATPPEPATVPAERGMDSQSKARQQWQLRWLCAGDLAQVECTTSTTRILGDSNGKESPRPRPAAATNARVIVGQAHRLESCLLRQPLRHS